MWNMKTKIVPVVTGALGTITISSFSCTQVTIGHRAAEGHTNEHHTQHSVSAGVNRFDLLLISGLTRRPPPNN